MECLSSYCLKYGRYDLQGTIDEFGTLGRFLRFLSPRYDFPNAFITSYRQLARKTVNGLGENQPILRAFCSLKGNRSWLRHLIQGVNWTILLQDRKKGVRINSKSLERQVYAPRLEPTAPIRLADRNHAHYPSRHSTILEKKTAQ